MAARRTPASAGAAQRPPKARKAPAPPAAPALPKARKAPALPKARKARRADECQQLEQLPNIGPAIAGDLRLLGVLHPRELAERDALQLYHALCQRTGKRHDPCVLDTFMAVTDFMRGAEPRPWWAYTAQRKSQYGAV